MRQWWELLAVSRMESDGASRREAVELSALTAEMAQGRRAVGAAGMARGGRWSRDFWWRGERALLGRAVENLLSTPALYSPEGREIG